MLLDRFLSPEGVRAVVGDDGAAAAELDAVDAAIVELAGKVALDATSATQADVDGLRSLGLTDAEVLDVALAASVRCFFSKALDGLGIGSIGTQQITTHRGRQPGPARGRGRAHATRRRR